MARTFLTLLMVGGMTIVGAFFTPFSAYGQPVCAVRASAIQAMAQQYQELPRAVLGVSLAGGLIEVWTTESGSTWSIFETQRHTRPDGTTVDVSCFLHAGKDWEVNAIPQAEPGEPS